MRISSRHDGGRERVGGVERRGARDEAWGGYSRAIILGRKYCIRELSTEYIGTSPMIRTILGLIRM